MATDTRAAAKVIVNPEKRSERNYFENNEPRNPAGEDFGSDNCDAEGKISNDQGQADY
jgi:hypothetical protein